MKKLYLLLACAVSMGAQAANLTFYVGDKTVTPGETIYFTDYQAEEFEPGVWDIYMNPHLSISSDFFTNTVSVTAECTSGQTIQMCVGGCTPGKTVVKDNLTVQTGAKLALEFEYINSEYEGTAVPDVTTRFKATDGEGDPVEFVLVMGPSGASITTVPAGDYIGATRAGITYSLESAKAFSLFSLTGNRVLATTLKGNGVLNTAKITKGVYVYTLGNKTGKIIIK